MVTIRSARPLTYRTGDQLRRRRPRPAPLLHLRRHVRQDIPELVTLATTADAVLLGITNAKAEGVNRLTKFVYRVAFGLRNVANQQRRASWVTPAAPAPTDYLTSPPTRRPRNQPTTHPREVRRA